MSPKRKKFSVSLDSKLSPFWSEFQDTISGIVFGQERAIRKIIRSLVVLESGLAGDLPPNPLLFVGPSGTGKTFLARTIAELWLGKAPKGQIGPLVKISGENFKSAHDGSALKGAPPGFVGYDDKATLEDVGVFDREKRLVPMRRMRDKIFREIEDEYPHFRDVMVAFGKPPNLKQGNVLDFLRHATDEDVLPDLVDRFAPFRSVLLVDEFEKMHLDVQKLFLGILDTGKLEMLNGRVIDFRRCQIIFTGNIGTELIAREFDGGGFGFGAMRKADAEGQNQKIYELVRDEVKKILDPALYSRIGHDGIVVLHALAEEDYVRIIDTAIRVTEQQIREQSDGTFRIHTTSEFRQFLLSLADTPREGARQIERIILRHIREPLANLIEAKELRDGDEILFSIRTGVADVQRTSRSGHRRKVISARSEGDWIEEMRRDFETKIDGLLGTYFPGRDDVPDLRTSDE